MIVEQGESQQQVFFAGASFDWNDGATETALFAVIFGVFIGLPLLLNNPFLLSSGKATFYIFLYIIGFFGHIDDIGGEAWQRLSKAKFMKALAFGFIGWLGIQVTFMFGLSLLSTEGEVQLTKLENVLFSMVFVAVSEELVFRDSLPYWFYNLLRLKTDEAFAFIASFIISAVSFGIMHVVAYRGDFVAVLKAIIAGIILGFIRIYGGLFASYFAHSFYNALVIGGLFIFFQ